MPEQTGQPTHRQFNDPVSVGKRSRQKLHLAAQCDKAALLAHIVKSGGFSQAAVVTKTKRDADALSAYLEAQGIKAAAIHGNRRAEENEAAAQAFKEGEVKLLITTDMILQGLGLDSLELIISHDLPSRPEHYFSRLGCLGETGLALSLVSPQEQKLLSAIEWAMKLEIPQEEVEGFVPTPASDAFEAPQRTKEQKKKPRHRKQRRKSDSKPKEK